VKGGFVERLPSSLLSILTMWLNFVSTETEQDQFWNERDLKQKLDQFKDYYNTQRAHSALNRKTPEIKNTEQAENMISFAKFHWKSQAQKLFQLPIAA
jgi:transposase InsO family protein